MNTQDYPNYKHVYYLHGALCFYNVGVKDIKILSNNNELIDVIENKINTGEFPLFVSEGTANDKLRVIENSNYLTFCLSNLAQSDKDLLIFGTNLSPNDSHIINAIGKSRRNIVFAIYKGDKTEEEIHAQELHYRSILGNNAKNLDFVDSATVFDFS